MFVTYYYVRYDTFASKFVQPRQYSYRIPFDVAFTLIVILSHNNDTPSTRYQIKWYFLPKIIAFQPWTNNPGESE